MIEFYHLKGEFSPYKFERFLSDHRYIYWIKGTKSEIVHLIDDFIDDRYENYFYLIELGDDVYLIASTVPIRVPFIPFYAKRKIKRRKSFLKLSVRLEISTTLKIFSVIGTAVLLFAYLYSEFVHVIWKNVNILINYLLVMFFNKLTKELEWDDVEAQRVHNRLIVKKKRRVNIKLPEHVKILIIGGIVTYLLYSFQRMPKEEKYPIIGALLLLTIITSPIWLTII